jgi:hypothetical protein
MPSLSSADKKHRQRNLVYFAAPQLWPEYPFLPIVRRKPGQDEECGPLLDAKGLYGRMGYSATVFKCNLFLIPRTLDEFLALPKETFDTPEEIFEAGWRFE